MSSLARDNPVYDVAQKAGLDTRSLNPYRENIKSIVEPTFMNPKKNLHVSVPPALLTRAQEAAEDDHTTVDELIRTALEQRLQARRRQKLYAYGEGQARLIGIREEDVPRIVEEWRAEHPQPER